jgi:hypothetical protein
MLSSVLERLRELYGDKFDYDLDVNARGSGFLRVDTREPGVPGLVLEYRILPGDMGAGFLLARRELLYGEQGDEYFAEGYYEQVLRRIRTLLDTGALTVDPSIRRDKKA